MRKELKTIEQIELYLNNRLNDAEKLDFEKALLADPDLKVAFNEQRIIQERIQVNAFKKALAAHIDNRPNPRTNGKGRLLFWGSILLLLTLITSLTIIYFPSNKQKNVTEEINSTPDAILNIEDEIIPEDSLLFEKEISSKETKKKQIAKTKEFVIPKDLQVPFESVMLNIDKGDTVIMRDFKSLIYIAPSSMKTKKGKLVKGDIELKYREFRAKEDMLFSGIPMIYNKNGEDYRFNSAGMFEIRAYQDGEELVMIPEKPILVDYYVTEAMEDLSFFALDDLTQNWEKLRDIEFGGFPVVRDLFNNNPILYDTSIVEKTPSLKGGFEAYKNYLLQNEVFQKVKEIGFGFQTDAFLTIDSQGDLKEINFYNKTAKLGFTDSLTYMIYKDLRGFESGEIDGDSSEMKLKLSLKIASKAGNNVESKKKEKFSVQYELNRDLQIKQLRALLSSYFDSLDVQKDSSANMVKFLFDAIGLGNNFNIEQNRKTNKFYELGDILVQAVPDTTFQAIEPIDTNYNNLLSAFRIFNFGVYNCDQIYRIQQPLAINASYIDENGEILTPRYLSLVDFTLNAAFRFDPFSFVMNKNSPTVLFLLNNQGDTYTLDAKSLQEMNIQSSGEYTFQLKNQKDKLSTKNDLIEILRVINN